MIAKLQSREDGASIVLALGLILLLTFAMATLSLFVLGDMTAGRAAMDQDKKIASSSKTAEEALTRINKLGDLSTVTGSANAQTSSDGKSTWWVEQPSSGNYAVRISTTIGDTSQVVSKPLLGRPVYSIFPSSQVVSGGKSAPLLYEPTLEGYYQASFHGTRMGDLTDTEGRWRQLLDTDRTSGANTNFSQLTNVKMLSYDPTVNGITPSASTGKGTWSTSLGFRMDDGTKTEKNSTVSFDREKFSGVTAEQNANAGSNVNPRVNCAGCSTNPRSYYGYDISYDQLDNAATANCVNPTKDWKSSTAVTPGHYNPSQDGTCFRSMHFDRSTTTVSPNNALIFTKSIQVGSPGLAAQVNAGQYADYLHIVGFGESTNLASGAPTLRVYPGSRMNSLTVAMGTNACAVNGTSTAPVKLYGSLTCAGKYDVSNAELWWDTTMESKWLTHPSATKMWEYND